MQKNVENLLLIGNSDWISVVSTQDPWQNIVNTFIKIVQMRWYYAICEQKITCHWILYWRRFRISITSCEDWWLHFDMGKFTGPRVVSSRLYHTSGQKHRLIRWVTDCSPSQQTVSAAFLPCTLVTRPSSLASGGAPPTHQIIHRVGLYAHLCATHPHTSMDPFLMSFPPSRGREDHKRRCSWALRSEPFDVLISGVSSGRYYLT